MIEEAVAEGFAEMLRNLKRWLLSKWHTHKGKKRESIVELLRAMCYEEEETRWQIAPDKSEIVCDLSTGIYHGVSGNPSYIELMDAFHIPFEYTEFANQILSDKSKWPDGVRYDGYQGDDIQIAITVFIALDYNDSPKDYIRGYMEYIHELQRQIHLGYNEYRQSHPLPTRPITQYNIYSDFS